IRSSSVCPTSVTRARPPPGSPSRTGRPSAGPWIARFGSPFTATSSHQPFAPRGRWRELEPAAADPAGSRKAERRRLRISRDLATTAARNLVAGRLGRLGGHDLELVHQAVVLVIEHVAVDHELPQVVAEVRGDVDRVAGVDE